MHPQANLHPADRLADLSGRWRTIRAIRHAGGSTARFEGVTEWRAEGLSRRAVEEGLLSQGHASFPARRETVWRPDASGIDIAFADGRPFHRIEGRDAHHDCRPDTYLLRYDVSAWPFWSVRWRVTGPRKDYRALTRYAPIP